MRAVVLLSIIFAAAFTAAAQSSSVSGIVRDAISKKGVESALIILKSKTDSLFTNTDAQGRFTINDVKTGRYICSVHSLGYEIDEQETLVITGKTSTVEFILQEKARQLETITVQSRPTNTSDGGAISIPIEKVMRMPANFFDPVRALTSYPGVVTSNDQANNIVVKGNSPTGLLWRLNGMDIVNPNHLANAGTFNDKPAANGGGVNILSAQMLDRTDFYSGNMPARYGNLSAAALDMTIRNGNPTKREYTAQASLIGLDFAAEGPMDKKGRTTYLVNGRYSTVGLLSQIGVKFGDEKINFKDISANINTKIGERGGNISFFGFGGNSTNKFYAKDSSEWKVDKDRFTILYDNNTYALGTRLDLPMKNSFTFSAGTTYSSNVQNRTSVSIPTPALPVQSSDYNTTRKLLSSFASIAGRLSSKWSGELGVMVNANEDHIKDNEILPTSAYNVDNTRSYVLFQPYGQLSFRYGKFLATAGLRYLHNTFGKQSADPRLNFQYQLTPTQSIYITGGQVSQMLPPGIYLAKPTGTPDYDFLRKKFVEAGHMIQLENWKLNSSVYYHYYDKVPGSFQERFSVLNYIEGVVQYPLTDDGKGRNYGVALQAERSFVDGYYLLAGASVYRSLYTAYNGGLERPTKFDGRYSLMVTGGREWTRQFEGRNKSFGIHGRVMYLGGLRDSPISESDSKITGVTSYVPRDINSITLNDYVRFDLRLSWRKDKKKYTRTIALDVQNIAGIKNQAYRYYDAFQGKVVMQYQVGFIPVLVYRIDF